MLDLHHEYSSVIIRKKISAHTIWTTLQKIMWSETSKSPKVTYYITSFRQHSWNDNIREIVNRLAVAGDEAVGGDGRTMGVAFQGQRWDFCNDSNVIGLDCIDVLVLILY